MTKNFLGTFTGPATDKPYVSDDDEEIDDLLNFLDDPHPKTGNKFNYSKPVKVKLGPKRVHVEEEDSEWDQEEDSGNEGEKKGRNSLDDSNQQAKGRFLTSGPKEPVQEKKKNLLGEQQKKDKQGPKETKDEYEYSSWGSTTSDQHSKDSKDLHNPALRKTCQSGRDALNTSRSHLPKAPVQVEKKNLEGEHQKKDKQGPKETKGEDEYSSWGSTTSDKHSKDSKDLHNPELGKTCQSGKDALNTSRSHLPKVPVQVEKKNLEGEQQRSGEQEPQGTQSEEEDSSWDSDSSDEESEDSETEEDSEDSDTEEDLPGPELGKTCQSGKDALNTSRSHLPKVPVQVEKKNLEGEHQKKDKQGPKETKGEDECSSRDSTTSDEHSKDSQTEEDLHNPALVKTCQSGRDALNMSRSHLPKVPVQVEKKNLEGEHQKKDKQGPNETKELSSLRAEVEEYKKMTEELQSDLKASQTQLQQSQQLNRLQQAEIEDLKAKISEQQQKVKEDKVHSTTVENLQDEIEKRERTISSMNDKINQMVSDIEEERATNRSLQKNHDDTVSQLQKNKKELEYFTQKNKELVCDNTRLWDEFTRQLEESQECEILAQNAVKNLKKSPNEVQLRKSQQRINELTAELEKRKRRDDKLKCDLEKYHIQLQQAKSQLEQDLRVRESLQLDVQTLQAEVERRNSTLSSLRETNEQLASDLKKAQAKNSSLQNQQDPEKLKRLSQKNQELETEVDSLRAELQEAKNRQVLPNQSDGEDFRKLEEELKKKSARYAKAYSKIQNLKTQLNEKSLALEESLSAQENLKAALKKAKQQVQVLEQQDGLSLHTSPYCKHQLREVNASSERLMRENTTLEQEKDELKAKLEETRWENKNTKFTIRTLEFTLDQLKEKDSESTKKMVTLEAALQEEKRKTSELQLKVDRAVYDQNREINMMKKEHESELRRLLREDRENERRSSAEELQRAKEKFDIQMKEQAEFSDTKARQVQILELRVSERESDLDWTRKKLRQAKDEINELEQENSRLFRDKRNMLLKQDELSLTCPT